MIGSNVLPLLYQSILQLTVFGSIWCSIVENDLFGTPKLIKGAMVDPDPWSMFRLPNQSVMCETFVHSYYLDERVEEVWKSNNDKFNIWDLSKTTHWTKQLGSIPSKSKDSLFEYNARLNSVVRVRQPTLYTFTSPSYPNTYPPNTDCIKIIRAPDENQRVIIGFRGPFDFEPSPGCLNDYLEVRDGEYGFSPLIGRFCVDNAQLHSIASTGRWLRLRFHTDSTIQKTGFQALYYFSKIRSPSKVLPTKHIITSVVTVERESRFETEDLSKLWNDYITPLNMKPEVVDRPTEFLIDFRTAHNNQVLLLHLNFIQFNLSDSKCGFSAAEIYDEFFLSDIELAQKPLKTGMKIKPVIIKQQLIPRVIRACNQSQLNPSIHVLGRGVVRLFLTPETPNLDSDQPNLPNDKNMDAAIRAKFVTYLPRIKVTATALVLDPCVQDFIPCVRPDDYGRYKEKFNPPELSTTPNPLGQQYGTIQTTQPSRYPIKSYTIFPTTSTTVASTEVEVTYCVPPELICNEQVNCPNEEDEKSCPRPPGGLEDFITTAATEDPLNEQFSTPTEKPNPASRGRTASITPADDEFQYHTSIIAGLLGFCAICGLISAGMTLFNRAKKAKHKTIGSVCNSLLFDSGTSLITALESESLSNLRNHQTNDNFQKLLMQKANDTEICNHKDRNQSFDSTLLEFNPATNKSTTHHTVKCPSSCLCHHSKSDQINDTPTNGRKISNIEDTGTLEPDSEEQPLTTQGISTHELADLFDRATKPLGYVRKLESSPAWNPALNSSMQWSRKDSSTPTKIKMPRLAEYQKHRSFGQLPYTLVTPVDKTHRFAHNPRSGSSPTTYGRHVWQCSKVSRSAPFSLKLEYRATATPDQFSSEEQHLSDGYLKRSFSVRPNQGSAFAICNSTHSIGQTTALAKPSMMIDSGISKTREKFNPRLDYGRPVEPNVFSIVDSQSYGKKSDRRKHFRGGAPKRAKHDENTWTTKRADLFSPENIPELSQIGINLKMAQQTNNRRLYLQDMSQSTSGELLDYKSATSNGHKPKRNQSHTKSNLHRTTQIVPIEQWAAETSRPHKIKGEIDQPCSYDKYGDTQSDSDVSGNRRLKRMHLEMGQVVMEPKVQMHRSNSDLMATPKVQIHSKMQHQPNGYIPDSSNVVYACNCNLGRIKMAFPSSFSVTDQYNHPSCQNIRRNISIADMRPRSDFYCGESGQFSTDSTSSESHEETHSDSQTEDLMDVTGCQNNIYMSPSDSPTSAADESPSETTDLNVRRTYIDKLQQTVVIRTSKGKTIQPNSAV